MNKSVSKVFEIYVFAFAFFFASRPINDADFWFHLKTGEYIFRTGVIPRTEIFSFSHYGSPWVAHGWLSGATFYALYSRIGFNFLIFLFALLAALAFWIVYKRCNSHPFIAGAAALLGVWAVLPTVGVRPRIFSLLFSSIFLAALSAYARRGTGKVIWLLIPLMALWANLHGGFFIGLALVGLTVIGLPLDAWAAGNKLSSISRRLRILVLVLLGCALAALVNPYGLRMYTFPISVLRSPIFQNLINDWLSPNFHQPDLRPLAALILLTILAVALSPRRVKPSDLLIFLASLYATLNAQRNMLVFSLVAPPLLANCLQDWFASTSFGKPFRQVSTAKSTRRDILLGAILLLPLILFAIRLRSTAYAPVTQARSQVPVKAVDFLRANQVIGKTFIAPNIWGGYLIWALPANPVYIDGRDVYPEDFVKEFVEITKGTIDWKVSFERHSVQIVLLEPRSVLARRLEESNEWERLYEDEMSVVFRRREQT